MFKSMIFSDNKEINNNRKKSLNKMFDLLNVKEKNIYLNILNSEKIDDIFMEKIKKEKIFKENESNFINFTLKNNFLLNFIILKILLDESFKNMMILENINLDSLYDKINI